MGLRQNESFDAAPLRIPKVTQQFAIMTHRRVLNEL